MLSSTSTMHVIARHIQHHSYHRLPFASTGYAHEIGVYCDCVPRTAGPTFPDRNYVLCMYFTCSWPVNLNVELECLAYLGWIQVAIFSLTCCECFLCVCPVFSLSNPPWKFDPVRISLAGKVSFWLFVWDRDGVLWNNTVLLETLPVAVAFLNAVCSFLSRFSSSMVCLYGCTGSNLIWGTSNIAICCSQHVALI